MSAANDGSRVFTVMAAAAGATGVVLGAFGAHALRGLLEADLAEAWRTAVQYQLWHASALLAVGLLVAARPGSRWLPAAGWAFVAGVLVFSGSLYLMVLSGARWLGALTPIGGTALIAGWIMTGIGAWRRP